MSPARITAPRKKPASRNTGAPLALRQRATLALLHLLTLLPPLSAKAHRRIGLLQARAGQPARAIPSFKAALAKGLRPHADLHHQLGRALLAVGRLAAAAEHFRCAIRLDPAACWSYQELGQALASQGLAFEAEAALRRGLAVCPGHRWLACHLAWLLESEQRYADSLDVLIEVGLNEAADPPCGPHLIPFRFRGLATPERIAGLQEIVARFPRNRKFTVLLSLLLVDAGDRVTAAEQLNRYRMLEWRQSARTRNLIPDPTQPAPVFLIIGQGKAGTTGLYEYLCQHPRVLPAVSKEVRFWSEHLGAGLDWYRTNFPPIPLSSGLITGEASPDYIHSSGVPELVARHLPEVRLILVLREPVSRAYSGYRMNQRLGRERRRWEDIVEHELSRMPSCPLRIEDVPDIDGYELPHRGYLLGSVLLPFLQNWLEHFPPDRLMILHNTEMHRDTVGAVRRVYRFLDLPDFVPDCTERHNVGRYEPMAPALRRRLEAWFAPHQAALGELLAALGVAPEPEKDTG